MRNAVNSTLACGCGVSTPVGGAASPILTPGGGLPEQVTGSMLSEEMCHLYSSGICRCQRLA